MKLTLGEISRVIEAELEGDPEQLIEGVSSLQDTTPARICFAEGARYLDQVCGGLPGAVIVDPDFPSVPGRTLLRVANPRHAFIRVTEMFVEPLVQEGIDASARVHDTAQLGDRVSLGGCVTVGPRAHLGDGTAVQAGAHIGPDVTIGRDCLIEANAVLLQGVTLGDRVIVHAGAVIGGEGFGFVWMEDHHHKVPQIGNVIIEDDVEIGCNSCVDRAALGVTRIGRGTKIDNLVQIGHNDDIGEDVIVCGQAGVAGSVTVENRVTIGGGAGLSDHIRVGANAVIGGGSGVSGNVAAEEAVFGYPARPIRRVKREQASLSRLPELLKAFAAQTKELEALKARVAELERVGKGED